jgi:hypothetical protein
VTIQCHSAFIVLPCYFDPIPLNNRPSGIFASFGILYRDHIWSQRNESRNGVYD